MAKTKKSRETAAQDRETPVDEKANIRTMTDEAYLTAVRQTLQSFGSNSTSEDINSSKDFWMHCRGAGIAPENCAMAIYGSVRHRHEVARTTIRENATAGASESPTGEQWEVVVKRGGVSIDDITSTAGRRPDEVTSGNAVFAGFNDDERAAAFSKKMTKAGYISSFGPRKEYTLHEDIGRRYWTKVIFHSETAAQVFREAIERGPWEANLLGQNVFTNAPMTTIMQTFDKTGVRGSVHREVEESDRSAMGDEKPASVEEKPAAAPSGVAAECSSCIPWQKVSRDADAAAANTELAKKYGAIKTAKDVYRVVGDALNKEDAEVFLVIPLDLRGELKAPPYEVARGQYSRVGVGVENVMAAVYHSHCEAFICVHNHPTGKVTPSSADRHLTEEIRAACRPLGKGVTFVDHCIVGSKCVYSIGEKKRYEV